MKLGRFDALFCGKLTVANNSRLTSPDILAQNVVYKPLAQRLLNETNNARIGTGHLLKTGLLFYGFHVIWTVNRTLNNEGAVSQ